MRSVVAVVALSSTVLLGGPLPAQSAPDSINEFAPRPAISFSAGVSQFDLAGTGTTSIVALRGEYPLVPALLIEGGVTIARLQQAFSERGMLLMPELQLQLQLPRRLAPFIGLGTGFAHDGLVALYGGDANRITFSGAAGLRAAITRQVGLRAELRIREFGTGFNGTTADWTLGAAWRF